MPDEEKIPINRDINISENRFKEEVPEILDILLLDRTRTTENTPHNIIWATDNYEHHGEGYRFEDEITVDCISGGDKGKIIMPRAQKTFQIQSLRRKEMAEVFTPAWICNKQNNLIDNAWFGRENVFNVENDNDQSWTSNETVDFKDKTLLQSYVKDVRLEITCGEAPYITSRYDVTKGTEMIPTNRRIGLLDRKLIAVNQFIKERISKGKVPSGERKQWYRWAFRALQTTYGFEWQGDNLLLAREAVFCTFLDYYQALKIWGENAIPPKSVLLKAAEIISWNLWQMDGLTYCMPSKIRNNLLPSCKIKEWIRNDDDKIIGNEITFAAVVNNNQNEKNFNVK